MPALLAVLMGLALGFASGGSIRTLAEVQLRLPYAVLSAFVLQGLARGRIGTEGSDLWGVLVWSSASLVLIALLVVQPRNAMLAVVGVGIASNVLVVLLNGYMPVLLPVGSAGPPAVAGFYALATTGTIAPLLGDCLPLPLLGQTYVFSLGDVLLVAGAAGFVVSGMLGGSGGEPRRHASNKA